MQHKLPGLCPTLVQEALLMPPRAGVLAAGRKQATARGQSPDPSITG